MLLVGEDSKKFINDYSRQFQRDFLKLLKTAHGEKKVHMNNFYQEYIRDKEHIHMNSTKWPSLTEFAKHLGREGICRVDEGERGLEIQWIDDSPEAIRRKEDIMKKERLAKGDEDIESRLLEQQIRRAREATKENPAKTMETSDQLETENSEDRMVASPIKVSLSLKAIAPKISARDIMAIDPNVAGAMESSLPKGTLRTTSEAEISKTPTNLDKEDTLTGKVSSSFAQKPKPITNPLARKNPLAVKKDAFIQEPEKKMSNAERIMKEELERKRLTQGRHDDGRKRQRLG